MKTIPGRYQSHHFLSDPSLAESKYFLTRRKLRKRPLLNPLRVLSFSKRSSEKRELIANATNIATRQEASRVSRSKNQRGRRVTLSSRSAELDKAQLKEDQAGRRDRGGGGEREGDPTRCSLTCPGPGSVTFGAKELKAKVKRSMLEAEGIATSPCWREIMKVARIGPPKSQG